LLRAEEINASLTAPTVGEGMDRPGFLERHPLVYRTLYRASDSRLKPDYVAQEFETSERRVRLERLRETWVDRFQRIARCIGENDRAVALDSLDAIVSCAGALIGDRLISRYAGRQIEL
jgi:hypothetical protein